jgi:hypothetical protein
MSFAKRIRRHENCSPANGAVAQFSVIGCGTLRAVTPIFPKVLIPLHADSTFTAVDAWVHMFTERRRGRFASRFSVGPLNSIAGMLDDERIPFRQNLTISEPCSIFKLSHQPVLPTWLM